MKRVFANFIYEMWQCNFIFAGEPNYFCDNLQPLYTNLSKNETTYCSNKYHCYEIITL